MNERPGFFDKAEHVRLVLRILFAICAAVVLLDLFYHRHVIHAWEDLWGFYAIFGFIACTVLVLVAKEMRKVLMRKEDYYSE